MIMPIIVYFFGIISIIDGAILDPALYLSPTPPLTTTLNNQAEKLWSQPLVRKQETVIGRKEEKKTLTESLETMDDAETFWPNYRLTRLRGIHIPLTFQVSGMYGGNSGTGVLTSGYMGVEDNNRVRAGSGYKSYGSHPSIRIYGSDTKPTWSGWGNGKWGHYGKG